MYRSSQGLLAVLVLFALAVFGVVRIGSAETHPVFQAWESAESVGNYSYTTRIDQETKPLPKLENVGLKTITEHIYIEGSVDRASDALDMQLWSDNGSAMTGGGSIEIKVANGVAQGRANGQPWQHVDDSSDFFAPGGDPLGYLNAATNIAEAGNETLTIPGQRVALSITKYSYDLDGEAFAMFIRDQVEADQVRKGELPTGVRVQASPDLMAMSGTGELWINNMTGLPVRQIIHTQMPPTEYDEVSATITTDFSDWDEEKLSAISFQQSANNSLSSVIRGLSSIDGTSVAVNASILFTALLFTVLLIYFGRNPQAYRLFTITMIYALVGIPLLNARDVAAYAAENNTQIERQEQERELDRQQRLIEAGIDSAEANQSALPYTLGRDATSGVTRDNITSRTEDYLESLLAQLPVTDDG